MEQFKPILGYWDIRGLAEPIRLLFAYNNIDYIDKTYTTGDAPTYDKSEWFNEKFKLNLAFPNLPYLIDGDIKITQSNAILRYIAAKNNLIGTNDKEIIQAYEMQDVAMDFRNFLIGLFYRPGMDWEEAKKKHLEINLPTKLEPFDNILNHRKWFAGDHLTFVDFIMYELLDQNRCLSSTCLDKCLNLTKFMNSFENLNTNLKEYIDSNKHKNRPINNKMAYFK